ncbi:MAG: hypothetical protein ABJB12_02635 [Pseudomonadota bacterium]
MCERAANSARFRLGCALALVAWSLGSCSTYDDSLLAGYNPSGGASAGSSPDDAGRSGAAVDAGAPGVAGNTNSSGGAGGGSSGGTGTGGDAGSDAGAPAVAGQPGVAGGTSVGGAVSTGGTGGTAGIGGTAGTGAAGAGGGQTSAYELIDDFEDQDALILLAPPRNGPWYVLQDAASAGTESPFTIAAVTGTGAAPGSTQALHLTATGFASLSWGAGVGANFVSHAVGTKQVAYDVSAYSGIHFYAKVATGKQTTVNVLIPTTYSDPDGGKCSEAMAGKHCSDHLFCQISGLKTTWAAYECDFAKLMQQNFGLPQTGLDPKSVYSMQFTFKATTALPADIWIDDVSFVKK